MKSLCVFCGSSPGAQPVFGDAATALGVELAQRGIGLVYGGASVGLMGRVADAVLGAGGRATGIITEALAEHELAHSTLNDLEIVGTMHERKARMAALADGFLMLPGGFGTFEEFMEAVTWAQLGIHDKPCGILNVDGFFDGLLGFLDHAVGMGFIRGTQVKGIAVRNDPAALLDALQRALAR